MKILHIDDSSKILRLYADMYDDDNNTIEGVPNGQDGLELVLKNDYDLILLDMCMPKYSGMDFLQDLKKHRPSELKKVVVTSALQFNESEVKGLKEMGIHSVEQKLSNIPQLQTFEKDKHQKKNQVKFSSVRILIIDDQLETTKMLSEFFDLKGFQTKVTNDPWEGLKYIQQEKFDAILLDIAMPQFSGLQIIASLATEEILKDQNIFLFSGSLNSHLQINDLLRRDGINGYLEKPMDLNEILKTITKNLNLQKVIHSETI